MESERRYAAAFKETMAPMLLVDPETGAVCDCNAAALALYGYSREEMLALTNRDFNLLPAEDLRKNMEEATARLRNRFVFQHRLKNGDIRTVEVFASPTPFQGKTFLFSILHDITEKQRLEEQLHLVTFDCALQAKILGGILESSPDYLYVFDRMRKFCFSGKKGAALFERTPEEMTGRSWEALGIPEERIAAFDEHLAQTFAAGKSKRGVLVFPAPHGDMPLEYASTPFAVKTASSTWSLLDACRSVGQRGAGRKTHGRTADSQPGETGDGDRPFSLRDEGDRRVARGGEPRRVMGAQGLR